MNNKPRKIARFPMLLAILMAVIIPPIGISIVLGFPVNWAWSKVLTWVVAAPSWTIGWAGRAWASTKEWIKDTGTSTPEWITKTWVSIIDLAPEWITKTWASIIDLAIELSEFFIVTIITLFIICLIPFLLQKYVESIRKSLSNIQKKIDEAFQGKSLPWKETFIESLKLAAYPLHLILRLIARLMLLLVIPITFLIPHLILILILISIHSVIDEPFSDWLQSNHNTNTETNNIEGTSKNKTNDDISTISQIVLLFGGLSVFTFLFKREDILAPLLNMRKKMVAVFRDTRLPRVDDIVESLLNTWRYTVKMTLWYIKRTVSESIKLIPAVLILCIGGYLSSFPAKTFINRTFTQNIAPQNVIVLNSRDFSPSYLFEKGTQFSLAYASQGSLSTKTGICPEDSNKEWLKLFKKAIWECSEKERVKLKIQGFASIAPVVPDSAKSDTLNYLIANQRAEALIYFLMLPPDSIYTKTKCKDVLDNISIWERKKENGTSVKPDSLWWKNSWGVTVNTEKVNNEEVNSESKSQLRFTFSVSNSATGGQKQKGLDVIYEPWQNHEEMKGTKPTDDGSLPKPRHYPLEFLNRTVQIIIEEGGCLTKEVPTVPKAEDNAGESD